MFGVVCVGWYVDCVDCYCYEVEECWVVVVIFVV